ncbi:hypothetical protein OIDMADRAFT_139250, partial [Oidiodendron maius Zn]
DLKERKKIIVLYIPITEMIADRITKPFSRNIFLRFKELIELITSRSRSK